MSSVTHFIRELTMFGSLGSAMGMTPVAVGLNDLLASHYISPPIPKSPNVFVFLVIMTALLFFRAPSHYKMIAESHQEQNMHNNDEPAAIAHIPL